MRKLLRAAALLAAALFALLAVGAAGAWPPISKEEAKMFGDRPLLQPEDFPASGTGSLGRNSCVTAGEPGSTAIDKDVSCDDVFPPDNENGIVAKPDEPNVLLGGSNDYQLFFNGATVVQRVPAGYFLSFDGGETWIDGQVPMQASFGAGDPSPAFDVRRNRALMASLSFVCGQGALFCSRGNLAVSTLDLEKAEQEAVENPENPNLPWSDQMVINGSASDVGEVQIFSDKEYITVDNNPDSPNYGNYYLVWARFRSEKKQEQCPPTVKGFCMTYDESPIFFTKSEDGGANWTDPVEISGRSNTRCTFQDDAEDSADTTGDFNRSPGRSQVADDPNACDQDQFAYPAVAPDGTLYVHFHNEQNSAAYEPPQRYDSQIMVVKSEDGGDTWYGDPNPAEQTGCVRQPESATAAVGACIVPIPIVDLEDSYDSFSQSDDGSEVAIADYPINVSGRTTLTGQQFRVNSAGTIAISPALAGSADDYRIYVVFADNCAGVRPGSGPTDPGDPAPPTPEAVTDTNLYYAYSDDGGVTWEGGNGPRDPTTPAVNACSTPAGVATRLIASDGLQSSDDQWFPWIASSPNGEKVAAVTMDASQFDGAVRDTYGFIAVTTGPTVLGEPPIFSEELALAGAASHPRQSRFFRAGAAAPLCFDCSLFIGDYNGVDVDSNGNIHGMWTDMRKPLATVQRPAGCDLDPETEAPECVPTTLFGEDAYYAQRPVHPGVPVPFPED